MAWVPLGRHNPKVAELRAVGKREFEHLTLVEGLKVVRDLVRRGLYPLALFATPSVASEVTADSVFSTCPANLPRYILPEAALQRAAATQHSQGLLAVYPVPKATSLSGEVLIYLDRLQDPANVGAVLRVAAAMGTSGVACSPGTADPFSPKAIRASAGWGLLIPVMPDVSWKAFRRQVAPHHCLVAAVPAGGVSALTWQPSLPLVVVFGNEGQGLSPEVNAEVKGRVTIPLARGVESLNVAVACGILLALLREACQQTYTEKRGRKL